MVDVKKKKSYSSSIVLIGNFSPVMFQPYWFRHCDILSENEFNAIDDNKEKTIITDQLTFFETENLTFKIERRRFALVAKKEPFELMVDTFTRLQEKLDSILIEKFGLNYSFHVDLETPENYKTFGDAIAPKTYWESLLSDAIESDSKPSGLVSMTMKKQTDFGSINVKVESSVIYNNSIFFDYNFHYEGDPKEPFDIFEVNEIIENRYSDFARYADKVSRDIIDKVFENGK